MSSTDTSAALQPLHRFEDVAKAYGVTVRVLKGQARALRAERVVIGHRWLFTSEQLAEFHRKLTVATGDEPPPDPLAGVRARLANRSHAAQRRHGKAGRATR